MNLFFLQFLLLLYQCCQQASSNCVSGTNTDHKPLVSCIDMGLRDIPSTVEWTTEVLIFKNNSFASLSWTAYTNFSKLHELDLSQNQVSALLRTSELVLPTLKILWLSSNRLQELPADAFAAAARLVEIYLDGNQLQTLNSAAFRGLTYLEILDLSQNRIRAVPKDLLYVIPSTVLKTFDIENNYLTSLPNKFFSSKPNIPYVYLSQNPWVCNCEMEYLQSWLDDESFNVYIHTGPDSILSDPESVVCDSPSHLKNRSIINLENGYCSEPEIQTDITPVTAIHDTETVLSEEHTLAQTTNTLIQMTDIQTMVEPILTTHSTHSKSRTLPPTTAIEAIVQSISTTHSTHSKARTLPPTIATEAIVQRISTTYSRQTKVNTLPPTIRTDTTVQPTSTTYSRQTKVNTFLPRTGTEITVEPTFLTTTMLPTGFSPSVRMFGEQGQRSKQNGPVVVYCWWLFVGYLCLCILLGLWLCVGCFWILRIYIRVYLPLSRWKRAKTEHLRHELKSVEGSAENRKIKTADRAEDISLPLEGTGGVQAVFRSMLFVSVSDEGESEGENAALTSVEMGQEDATAGEEGETGPVSIKRRENQDVIRKSLYRVVNRDGEPSVLRHMQSYELSDRDPEMKQESRELMTRYSLILREEQVDGKQEESRVGSKERSSRSGVTAGNEWVVGEWEWKPGERGPAGQSMNVGDPMALMPLMATGVDFLPGNIDTSAVDSHDTSETSV
uniref:Platelet glycoprotein Ib alpha chain-like n=1 Tax=Paramormyrops kingsleyae TaxID=1676925 RepID=A0A3B3QI58_9TELE|nr:platelet glycoprotein Ib alpha chain-like [Paramormyrops kingsleyae]